MKKLSFVLLLFTLNSCISYHKTYQNRRAIVLKDSVVISVRYSEGINGFIKVRHIMPAISISPTWESKNINLPIEVDVDSLSQLQSTFFNLKVEKVYSSGVADTMGKKKLYLNTNKSEITLLYKHPRISVKHKDYKAKQKIWIPSITFKQGGETYVLKGFEAVYPNR